MKDKIIIFIIGALVGAVIATGAFYIYTKNNKITSESCETTQMNNENGEAPAMPNGENGQPPSMPNGENGEPPSMPNGEEPPAKPDGEEPPAKQDGEETQKTN